MNFLRSKVPQFPNLQIFKSSNNKNVLCLYSLFIGRGMPRPYFFTLHQFAKIVKMCETGVKVYNLSKYLFCSVLHQFSTVSFTISMRLLCA